MILENYNNTLKENVETELSFIINALPIIQVRPFDPKVLADQEFILPYFVDSPLNISYENDVLCSTFTTIVSLDEDTLPESEVKRKGFRWKQTTYAGELVISLSFDNNRTFGENVGLGEHTLSIRTIESSGIGSDTKFFKFYVVLQETQNDIFDLSNIEEFEASERNFEWMTVTPYWFLRPADENGYYLPVSIFKRTDWIGATLNATRNIDYRVRFVRENSILTKINVEVHGTIYYPKFTLNGRSFGPITINLNSKTQNQPDEEGEEITYGTYFIKDTCIVNGNEVPLVNYLSKGNPLTNLTDQQIKTLLDPPAEARITASRNKLGIQFLLWACDAYCRQHGKKGFKLPKYEYVISYENGLDFTETAVINSLTSSGTLNPISVDTNGNYFCSRNDIWFPNKNIIIDFNGSTIRSLNCSPPEVINYKHGSSNPYDLLQRKIVTVLWGYCVEIKNLHVIGDYCNAITDNNKPEGQEAKYGENRGGVTLLRCRFATLENVRISHTMGYELTGGNNVPHTQYYSIPTFDKFGYIDYNGDVIEVERVKSNPLVTTEVYDPITETYYESVTEDVGQDTTPEEAAELIINPLDDQVTDDGACSIMYTSEYTNIGVIATQSKYNRAFHIIFDSRLSSGNAGPELLGRYRSDGDAMFVSFYNSNNKFIKTIKIRIWDTGFVPYGATKCKISAIGCIYETSINALVATRSNGTTYSGLLFSSHDYWLMGNRIINCIVHDTRTCITTVAGFLSYMDGLMTYNIAGQSNSHGKLTSLLGDVEDAGNNHYHICYKRWSHIDGLLGTINAQHGNDVCCIDCPSLGIEHKEIRDGIISNSIIGLTLRAATFRMIRKNIQITNNYVRSRISYSLNGFEYPMTFYLKKCFIANKADDPTIEQITTDIDSSININNYGTRSN